MLTRRGLIGAALAAAAARYLPFPVPAAAGETVSFSMSVDPATMRRRARAARWGRTRTLRAPRRFSLLGLRWSGPRELAAEVRFRRHGRWTGWMPLQAVAGHGPDGSGAPRVTLPVWSGPSRVFQLRLSRPVSALRVELVDVATGRAARASSTGGVEPEPAARSSSAGPPPMVLRSQWTDSRTRTPRSGPTYGRVHLAFVHHTVTSNSYTRSESPSVVRAIAHYHRNVLGWTDIGYNFLVDRYGTIYEGRNGGIDRPVVGAQAQGYNSQSTGIAVMGTHSDVSASRATVNALANLLAWKLAVHDAPVEGRVTVTSQGGSSNRYPAGRRVTFERISGHRHGNRTACPGDRLFAQLPEIRRRAAAATPAVGAISLSLGTRRTDFREEVSVSGRLTLVDEGETVAGRRLEIQISNVSGRSFRTVQRVTTAPDGTYEGTVRSGYTRRVRVRFPGEGDLPPIVSRTMELGVRSRIEAEVARPRVARGRAAVVHGAARPVATRRIQVVVYRRQPGGRYELVDLVWGAMRRGRFRVRVPLGRRPGLYRLQVRFPTIRRNVVTRSDELFVRMLR